MHHKWFPSPLSCPSSLTEYTLNSLLAILSPSVSARAFLHFDPVQSSVNAKEVSQWVFHDATKLPPLKCLKNPVNTQLSVKCAWDISVLTYLQGIIDFLHLTTLF